MMMPTCQKRHQSVTEACPKYAQSMPKSNTECGWPAMCERSAAKAAPYSVCVSVCPLPFFRQLSQCIMSGQRGAGGVVLPRWAGACGSPEAFLWPWGRLRGALLAAAMVVAAGRCVRLYTAVGHKRAGSRLTTYYSLLTAGGRR